MRQACNCPDFPEEAIFAEGCRQVRPKNLYGKVAGMALFFREVDGSHTPAAEDPFQQIAVLKSALKTTELELLVRHVRLGWCTVPAGV